MDQTKHEKNNQNLIKKGVRKASQKAKSGRKTTALLRTPTLKKVRQTGAFRKNPPQVLKLKGKTAVFIDWANVYNWKNSLKKEVDLTPGKENVTLTWKLVWIASKNWKNSTVSLFSLVTETLPPSTKD